MVRKKLLIAMISIAITMTGALAMLCGHFFARNIAEGAIVEEIQKKEQQIDLLVEATLAPTPTQEVSNKQVLGDFILTFYCGCETCNGSWAGQPTAMGTPLTEGKTIAVDPSIIPLGAKVEIEGLGVRVAEDTGSAIKGHHIDIYMNNHEACLINGVQYATVWVLE